MQVSLNRRERKVIQQIAIIQLEALDKLLQGDTKEDIVLWCIEFNIEKRDLYKAIERNIKTYESLIDNPNSFLNLPEDDLSLVRHILHRHIKLPSMQKAKISIWRKMMYFDSFNFNPN
jgi:hypothetical protein